MSPEGICRVEGCGCKAQSRGLCFKHARAVVDPDSPYHAEAVAVQLPSRKGKRRKPADEPAPAKPAKPARQPVGRSAEAAADSAAKSPKPNAPHKKADEQAAAYELAESLGLLTLDLPEGRAVIRTHRGKGVVVTDVGARRPLTLGYAGKLDEEGARASKAAGSLTALATELHLPQAQTDEGLLVAAPETGKVVLITPSGRLVPAKLTIGEAG